MAVSPNGKLVAGLRFAVGRVLVHVMSERTADTGWIARDRTRPMRQIRAHRREVGDA